MGSETCAKEAQTPQKLVVPAVPVPDPGVLQERVQCFMCMMSESPYCAQPGGLKQCSWHLRAAPAILSDALRTATANWGCIVWLLFRNCTL